MDGGALRERLIKWMDERDQASNIQEMMENLGVENVETGFQV